ncbi:MAG TPA: hypothetical protein VNZ45_17985, partial [Bacteroidia bacterium]|nr:hypothetical protein [Bacteroidia bacterium]
GTASTMNNPMPPIPTLGEMAKTLAPAVVGTAAQFIPGLPEVEGAGWAANLLGIPLLRGAIGAAAQGGTQAGMNAMGINGKEAQANPSQGVAQQAALGGIGGAASVVPEAFFGKAFPWLKSKFLSSPTEGAEFPVETSSLLKGIAAKPGSAAAMGYEVPVSNLLNNALEKSYAAPTADTSQFIQELLNSNPQDFMSHIPPENANMSAVPIAQLQSDVSNALTQQAENANLLNKYAKGGALYGRSVPGVLQSSLLTKALTSAEKEASDKANEAKNGLINGLFK